MRASFPAFQRNKEGLFLPLWEERRYHSAEPAPAPPFPHGSRQPVPFPAEAAEFRSPHPSKAAGSAPWCGIPHMTVPDFCETIRIFPLIFSAFFPPWRSVLYRLKNASSGTFFNHSSDQLVFSISNQAFPALRRKTPFSCGSPGRPVAACFRFSSCCWGPAHRAGHPR